MMSNRAAFLVAALLVAGAILLPSRAFDVAPNPPAPLPVIEIVIAPADQWRDYLHTQVVSAGLADRDEAIISAIFQCESSWQHYWPGTKEAKVSKGNTGLGQVNKVAHEAEYTALGLDMFDPFDNIAYTVLLYGRQGIGPWRPWSGHCFVPLLKKQGITL